MVYEAVVGRVTRTPKLPVTGGGGGDVLGDAVGEASAVGDGDTSEDAVAEGLACGLGDAFAWDPFPPPHAHRRTATASRDVESFMARIMEINATLRRELRFRYDPAPEAGPDPHPQGIARRGTE
jgi:hypothetical protein